MIDEESLPNSNVLGRVGLLTAESPPINWHQHTYTSYDP
jgi:hypothetical protein